jgi:tryptophan synthase beta chain
MRVTKVNNMTEKYNMPDERGHFGPCGGMFVAETLIPPIQELNAAYQRYLTDPEFIAELDADLQHYVGRPSPLYHAERWSRELGGAQIYLKREDLNHTGAHKVNNTIGQALLAKRMGKTRIIAETGAGQHGVATATVAARLGLECVVYMTVTRHAAEPPVADFDFCCHGPAGQPGGPEHTQREDQSA